jgi:hypothetical protein
MASALPDYVCLNSSSNIHHIFLDQIVISWAANWALVLCAEPITDG